MLKFFSQILQPKPTYSLMNDAWIAEQSMLRPITSSMIYPFHHKQISTVDLTEELKENLGELAAKRAIERQISFGTSSYGYDVRLHPTYKIFSAEAAARYGIAYIDPKNFDERLCIERTAIDNHILLPPHSFILGRIMEYVRMPENALAFLLNKSTYARCGVHVWTTVIEPGWHGDIVIEIANHTPIPVRLYAEEGIGQLVFLTGKKPLTPYNRRPGGGKYQGQIGITSPRV